MNDRANQAGSAYTILSDPRRLAALARTGLFPDVPLASTDGVLDRFTSLAARLLHEAHRRNLPKDAIVEQALEKVLTQDAERAEWLSQSECRLREVWDNDEDDAYNALLAE